MGVVYPEANNLARDIHRDFPNLGLSISQIKKLLAKRVPSGSGELISLKDSYRGANREGKLKALRVLFSEDGFVRVSELGLFKA